MITDTTFGIVHQNLLWSTTQINIKHIKDKILPTCLFLRVTSRFPINLTHHAGIINLNNIFWGLTLQMYSFLDLYNPKHLHHSNMVTTNSLIQKHKTLSSGILLSHKQRTKASFLRDVDRPLLDPRSRMADDVDFKCKKKYIYSKSNIFQERKITTKHNKMSVFHPEHLL